eukprot:Opistho-2@34004
MCVVMHAAVVYAWTVPRAQACARRAQRTATEPTAKRFAIAMEARARTARVATGCVYRAQHSTMGHNVVYSAMRRSHVAVGAPAIVGAAVSARLHSRDSPAMRVRRRCLGRRVPDSAHWHAPHAVTASGALGCARHVHRACTGRPASSGARASLSVIAMPGPLEQATVRHAQRTLLERNAPVRAAAMAVFAARDRPGADCVRLVLPVFTEPRALFAVTAMEARAVTDRPETAHALRAQPAFTGHRVRRVAAATAARAVKDPLATASARRVLPGAMARRVGRSASARASRVAMDRRGMARARFSAPRAFSVRAANSSVHATEAAVAMA